MDKVELYHVDHIIHKCKEPHLIIGHFQWFRKRKQNLTNRTKTILFKY
jgi:hypothetical protein